MIREMHPEDLDRKACFFLTFNTVDCVDVFIRPVYKQVVVHSLNHFISNKRLSVYGWCLMTNHLHLLARPMNGDTIASFEKDYKDFTAKKIFEAVETEPLTRKSWLMRHLETGMGNGRNFQVWDDGVGRATSIDIRKTDLLLEHFEHIHQAPVRDRVVDIPGEYKYSSARDYTGMTGLVDVVRLPLIEQRLAAAENINGTFLVKYIRN